jgi:hypothetical protein
MLRVETTPACLRIVDDGAPDGHRVKFQALRTRSTAAIDTAAGELRHGCGDGAAQAFLAGVVLGATVVARQAG